MKKQAFNMVSLPQLNEEELTLFVSHTIRANETVSEAVVSAFSEANINVFDEETTLEEWVNTDALEEFDWNSRRPFYVSSPVWEHQVVVTPDEVRIYSDTPVR